jgi:hypothetical protein
MEQVLCGDEYCIVEVTLISVEREAFWAVGRALEKTDRYRLASQTRLVKLNGLGFGYSPGPEEGYALPHI